jgi:hypothetical protein
MSRHGSSSAAGGAARDAPLLPACLPAVQRQRRLLEVMIEHDSDGSRETRPTLQLYGTDTRLGYIMIGSNAAIPLLAQKQNLARSKGTQMYVN